MFVKGHKNPEISYLRNKRVFRRAAKLLKIGLFFLFTPNFIITYLKEIVNKNIAKTKIFFSKVLTWAEFSIDMGGMYDIVAWFFGR